MFTLSGQGDTDVFLASPEALDWCENVNPGDTTITDVAWNSLAPFLRDGASRQDIKDGLYITSGSADNDAAMFLASVCRSFDRQRDALAAAAEQGWEIAVEEYEGCLY